MLLAILVTSWHYSYANLQTTLITINKYYDTNVDARYNFLAEKQKDMNNHTQTILADIVDNGSTTSSSSQASKFYFEYSRSGGQISSLGGTISYNSGSNPRHILFTNANGQVTKSDISNPNGLRQLTDLRQLFSSNRHLFEKNIDYRTGTCNDCIEHNLTVAINNNSNNNPPHYLVWYNESSTTVPYDIKEIGQTIVNLCGCGKNFYR